MFRTVLSISLVVALLGCVSARTQQSIVTSTNGRVSHRGERVLRFRPTSQADHDAILRVCDTTYCDIWKHHSNEVDIRVTPKSEAAFKAAGIKHAVWIEDVEDLTNNQQRMIEAVAANSTSTFFDNYHSFDDLMSTLTAWAGNHSDIAKIVSAGKSLEGRDIQGIVITSPASGNTTFPKPAIFYNGLQHAREWIGGATVMYIINQLLTGYNVDNATTVLVNEIEWHLFPSINPDGYDYTWTKDRMWRKNRRKDNLFCAGVDLNRNWGFKWNTGGSSGNACSETYHGPSAFSEPEETAVSKYITANTQIQGYIDFHSYSQLWMNPWGYTDSPCKDNDVQLQLSKLAVEAIKSVNGLTYNYGPIATTIYPASGSSADWTYGSAGVVYSYGVELRDTGEYGFVLPPTEIIPQGKEIWAAVQEMGKFIAQNPRPRTNPGPTKVIRK